MSSQYIGNYLYVVFNSLFKILVNVTFFNINYFWAPFVAFRPNLWYIAIFDTKMALKRKKKKVFKVSQKNILIIKTGPKKRAQKKPNKKAQENG
jgi:hypothetical protein